MNDENNVTSTGVWGFIRLFTCCWYFHDNFKFTWQIYNLKKNRGGKCLVDSGPWLVEKVKLKCTKRKIYWVRIPAKSAFLRWFLLCITYRCIKYCFSPRIRIYIMRFSNFWTNCQRHSIGIKKKNCYAL